MPNFSSSHIRDVVLCVMNRPILILSREPARSSRPSDLKAEVWNMSVLESVSWHLVCNKYLLNESEINFRFLSMPFKKIAVCEFGRFFWVIFVNLHILSYKMGKIISNTEACYED